MGRSISVIAAALIVGALTAACGQATNDPLGAEASGVARSAPPKPSTPAQSTPISWGDATLVEGRLTFGFGDGRLTTDPDGTTHSRGGPLTETLFANDPRVSGKATGTWNSDRWDGTAGGALVQWGTLELINKGGSWKGPYAGVYTTETGDQIYRWWVGHGGYEGLTFFMWITDAETFAWKGLIYKGDPPPER